MVIFPVVSLLNPPNQGYRLKQKRPHRVFLLEDLRDYDAENGWRATKSHGVLTARLPLGSAVILASDGVWEKAGEERSNWLRHE